MGFENRLGSPRNGQEVADRQTAPSRDRQDPTKIRMVDPLNSRPPYFRGRVVRRGGTGVPDTRRPSTGRSSTGGPSTGRHK
jgi:hypothetical protein